ncbi:MAG: ABC transporter permease [Anaerolineaceae bacterium]|nr:ABC transporter permease [Anaerolineaceae bacterium]
MTEQTHTSSPAAAVAQLKLTNARPQRNRTLRRFLKHRVAIAAVIVLTVIALVSIFAPVLERYGDDKIDLRAAGQPPSADHWFGTDRVGRDIWSRTLNGGPISLSVGVGATLIATSIGTVLGAVSGFYRGWVDNIIMRITDIVMTFPSIVIMLTLAALLPRSVWAIILIIGGLSWPAVARLVRAQFLSIRESEFVVAARCIGVQDRRIIMNHILPNVVAPLVALITFSIGSAILTEAGLSFLGLGVPPPTPSWGNMLESARNLDILQNLPWMWIPPAVMTVLTVLCVNFIGDGIRDAIDPRLVL